MATIQERLQRKREPLDKWSIREQLCLSFAVAKVGDQNWMSVSRSLKAFGDGRPADWFHQKNCAAQYGALLENIEQPKRKKRTSGVEIQEPPADMILKKLIQERLNEMQKLMEEERSEYKKLQEEMALLKSGSLTEEELDQMCKQMDEEEQQKEVEAVKHAQWLKEREIRKAELERVWRPPIKVIQTGQKRRASDSIDQLMQSTENETESKASVETPPTPTKSGLSPLLTSLLKSPSHVQNVATSSILHSAITSTQRPINSNTNPTIASLLNSNTPVQVSPGIQHLVSTAIAQEPPQSTSNQKDPIVDLLENADGLPNLEEIENTMLSVADGEFPEIKEEVDVIISDLIENADIVNDPEKLLDGDDIISNLENELEELDNKEKAEKAEKEAEKQKQSQPAPAVPDQKIVSSPAPTKEPMKEPEIDPFEFQEDPEYEVKLSSRSASNSVQTATTAVSTPPEEVHAESPVVESSPESEEVAADISSDDDSNTTAEEVKATSVPQAKAEPVGGSVEIVEVVVIEDEDIGKELNKSQIQDIVHSTNARLRPALPMAVPDEVTIKEEPNSSFDDSQEEKEEIKAKSPESAEEKSSDLSSKSEDLKVEVKEEKPEEPSTSSARRDTFTPDLDIYDENIEVTKLDKVGKIKRDYSRTKKKEETDFDILLAVNQAVSANIEEEPDSNSEEERKKPSGEPEVKVENEQSHSPWSEEVEQETEPEQEQGQESRPNTRRYSTPATPIDSVPNSPASSYFEDDRDFRSWKKSLMLVYSRLSNHKYASWFQKPITNDHAPGYHKMVKRPMDLSTIKKNIESGAIRTTNEFKRDILLMFNNAIMYNKTDDTVYKMTADIQAEAVEQIKILLQAQTDTPAPARRETRTSEGPGSKRKRDSEHMQVKSKKRKED